MDGMEHAMVATLTTDIPLNGSTPFYDQITGELMTDSDVLGSSSTPDAQGSRNVFSPLLNCRPHETLICNVTL